MAPLDQRLAAPDKPNAVLLARHNLALRVTDADERTRTVRTFDGRPAVQAYADAVGVSIAELPKRFRDHPVGLVTSDGEPFVRSPMQVKGSELVFYCKVSVGMELHLLRPRDIVEDTGRDLRAAIASLGGCSGVINFHCILRTLELEEKGMCPAYGGLFRDVPTIGLSTLRVFKSITVTGGSTS